MASVGGSVAGGGRGGLGVEGAAADGGVAVVGGSGGGGDGRIGAEGGAVGGGVGSTHRCLCFNVECHLVAGVVPGGGGLDGAALAAVAEAAAGSGAAASLRAAAATAAVATTSDGPASAEEKEAAGSSLSRRREPDDAVDAGRVPVAADLRPAALSMAGATIKHAALVREEIVTVNVPGAGDASLKSTSVDSARWRLVFCGCCDVFVFAERVGLEQASHLPGTRATTSSGVVGVAASSSSPPPASSSSPPSSSPPTAPGGVAEAAGAPSTPSGPGAMATPVASPAAAGGILGRILGFGSRRGSPQQQQAGGEALAVGAVSPPPPGGSSSGVSPTPSSSGQRAAGVALVNAALPQSERLDEALGHLLRRVGATDEEVHVAQTNLRATSPPPATLDDTTTTTALVESDDALYGTRGAAMARFLWSPAFEMFLANSADGSNALIEFPQPDNAEAYASFKRVNAKLELSLDRSRREMEERVKAFRLVQEERFAAEQHTAYRDRKLLMHRMWRTQHDSWTRVAPPASTAPHDFSGGGGSSSGGDGGGGGDVAGTDDADSGSVGPPPSQSTAIGPDGGVDAAEPAIGDDPAAAVAGEDDVSAGTAANPPAKHGRTAGPQAGGATTGADAASAASAADDGGGGAGGAGGGGDGGGDGGDGGGAATETATTAASTAAAASGGSELRGRRRRPGRRRRAVRDPEDADLFAIDDGGAGFAPGSSEMSDSNSESESDSNSDSGAAVADSSSSASSPSSGSDDDGDDDEGTGFTQRAERRRHRRRARARGFMMRGSGSGGAPMGAVAAAGIHADMTGTSLPRQIPRARPPQLRSLVAEASAGAGAHRLGDEDDADRPEVALSLQLERGEDVFANLPDPSSTVDDDRRTRLTVQPGSSLAGPPVTIPGTTRQAGGFADVASGGSGSGAGGGDTRGGKAEEGDPAPGGTGGDDTGAAGIPVGQSFDVPVSLNYSVGSYSARRME